MTSRHQGTTCPHCPDGHKRPSRGGWSVYVTSGRDLDGQPISIAVERTDGSHVSNADADWIRTILNDVGRR
jgi:hypothetical protein